MKKIYLYTVMGVAFLTGAASCSDDYFDIDYYDIIQPKILLTSQAYIEQGLMSVYDELYNNNLTPNVVFANCPMLDMRPTGWDYQFGNWSWLTDHNYVASSWNTPFNAVARANTFLVNLRDADVNIFDDGENTRKIIEAQARAIRAYYYSQLVKNFGGVPLLEEGDTYTGAPDKPRNTAEEVWQLVINDLEYCKGILGWDPWKGQRGRTTLGMVKYYLAQAYMYTNRFADAKKELKDIIESGRYALNPCYGQIHLEGQYWQSESIWEVCYPVFEDMTWGVFSKTDAVWMPAQQFGAVEYGGWGPQMTSYEFVWSFEQGDKRLDYEVAQYGHIHPFINNYVGLTKGWRSAYVGIDNLPSNFVMKVWKEIPGLGGKECVGMPATVARLAGAYLDYAECCFQLEGENSTEGWEYIQKVRDRAWGALEPSSTYNKPFPIALNTDPTVKAPDAKAFYSTYKRTAGKISGPYKRLVGGNDETPIYEDGPIYTSTYSYTPYTSPAWKVALLSERRHEFYCEYSLWYDAIRMGIVKEYLDAEYPKNNENIIFQEIPGYGTTDFFVPNPHTKRTFDYDKKWELYPIPIDEINRNKAIVQNPGYGGN
ncbi:hypothetical protein AGMMS49574_19380 [Bacteroidia bacterium]|nr:hypothetical protein AGMMS49574_19380 [Bacteroidia bacterium]